MPNVDILYQFLTEIFDHLRNDHNTLYQCCVVNSQFRQSASKILYARVVLSPAFEPVLNLSRDGIPVHSPLISASLPHNAGNVLSLEISGFLSPRPALLNRLGAQLNAAVQSFVNLRSITLAPNTFHADLFIDVLRTLTNHESLYSLSVNASCLDEAKTDILLEIKNLQQLTLIDPTRAILQVLPEWLGRLSQSSTELHLKANCGSITPGVLRSFTPYLRRIHALSLGLSYSLTDEDVFSFLGQLSGLRSVRLHYYLQLKSPAALPLLSKMRSFTVLYPRMETRGEVNHFCRWVRRAISSSSLESLNLVCETTDENTKSGANVSFDGLINHISEKHSGTIRFLDMKSAFIGPAAFQRLCRSCTNIETLSVAVNLQSLLSFIDTASPLHELHTVQFGIRNSKRNRVTANVGQATAVILHGPPRLRRVAINGAEWEGSWITENSLKTKFIVVPVNKASSTYSPQVKSALS